MMVLMTSAPYDGRRATACADVIVAADLRRTYRKREGWFRSPELVEAVRGHQLHGPPRHRLRHARPERRRQDHHHQDALDAADPDLRNGLGRRLRRGPRRRWTYGGGSACSSAATRASTTSFRPRRTCATSGASTAWPTTLITRRSAELLEQVGLTDRADERVESYSRGMKQRLHIAKTLVHRPPVVILDEPTIGLDPAAAIEVRALIAGLTPQHTVLLTTHDMHEADVLCSQLAIVDRGVIVAEGTPDQLKAARPWPARSSSGCPRRSRRARPARPAPRRPARRSRR